MSKRNNCEACEYKNGKYTGHCLIFKTEPNDICTEFRVCTTPTRSELEKELRDARISILNKIHDY